MAALAPDEIFAGYRLERVLGRGGMGVVWLAWEGPPLSRPVALKLVAPELAGEGRFRERFLREARLAASLEHPHVCPVYAAGEVEGRLFLAQRFLEGEDLGSLVAREGRLAPERALVLLGQIAAALDAAHARGLLHRDVKPGNVLLAGGTAYLVDFGLAREAVGGGTEAGELAGTLTYLAPELVEGGEASAASDRYSFACLSFELLAGEPPFVGEHAAALMFAHLRAEPPALAERVPELAGLDAVLARALAKQPQERFGSCAELVEALRAGLAAPSPAAAAADGPGLPRPPTPLVGRERELAELEWLLGSERLVTVTGPGGIGKTRVALAVCERLSGSFRGGVRFVQLAALTDPALLPATLALALEVEERPGEELADTLAGALEGEELLLCLDNLEQLLEAAPFLGELLARSPGLRLLVTSRAPLRLAGEQEYPLPSLEAGEAAELFAGRALAVDPGFTAEEHGEAVAAICERLDRLPLALELAAARVRLLSAPALLERLDRALPLLTGGARDLPERQQTLRAAIEWSYELLHPEEQRLFRALSVFAGGFELDAAAAVAELDELELLDALSLLVEHSLVRRRDGEARFLLLETIRQYAAEQLEASGEADETRGRHARYYLDFAQPGALHFHVPEQISWLPAAERERANLRAALGWLGEHGTVDEALQLAQRLSGLWYHRGPLLEGIESLERVLARSGGDPPLRARAIRRAGNLTYVRGRYPQARALYSESMRLWQALEAPNEVAMDLSNLGMVALDEGDLTQAKDAFEEALAIIRRLGDRPLESMVLTNLGIVTQRIGDYASARVYYEESLRLDREAGDAFGLGSGALNLGSLAHDEGRADEAARHLLSALQQFRTLEVDEGVLTCLEALAGLAAERQVGPRAAVLLAACEQQRERLGAAVPGMNRAKIDGAVALLRERLDTDELVSAQERGRSLSLDEAGELGLEVAAAVAATEPARRLR
jgi:predicted ATPase